MHHQFIPLNTQRISELLMSQKLSTPFTLHVLTSIDSTNCYLNDLPISNTLDVCCAEIQTQGRGRFGKHWHSPFGENIYCSSRWKLNRDLVKHSGLSLVCSLAILATLDEIQGSSDIQIKWPNDILWGTKKLCGTLIECTSESKDTVQAIIGIGLNVNSETENASSPDIPWCSLYDISKHPFDRNVLIAKLLSNLERYLTQLMRHDLNYFMHEWNKADYLRGKKIKVSHSLNTLTGVACGINQTGQLIVQDAAGLKHVFSSGDTSLLEF